MDISDTLAPKSDQLDAVDLLGGPRVFTITKVSAGNDEQPVNVHLAEFDRVWRPGKSMRRVLASCWGADASVWVGRRVELYCDPDVQFGGKSVGGTRISRLSHIEKAKATPLLIKRGQSAMFTVKPLPADAQPAPAAAAPPAPPAPAADPSSPPVSSATLADLVDLFELKGSAPAGRVAWVNYVTGGAVTALEQITEAQANQVMDKLADRPNAAPSAEDPS